MEIGFSEGDGLIWPKISGRRGRPPLTILHVGKLDASTSLWYKNVGRRLSQFDAFRVCYVNGGVFFRSFRSLSFTIHAFDRQTGGSPVARPRMHSCSAVKIGGNGGHSDGGRRLHPA